MTGMLGVGIGEVVVPQLVKKNDVPVPIAAGTSVLVVFLNAVGEYLPSYPISILDSSSITSCIYFSKGYERTDPHLSRCGST